MRFATRVVLTGVLLSAIAAPAAVNRPAAASLQPACVQRIDLAERLAARKLRVVNREATSIEGVAGGVRLSAAPGAGLAWIEGTDVAQGTIEIDIRGKDVLQQSFVGIAFRGRDDTSYEAVYLRPFNFRAADPVRHQHAVQYVSLPDFDWPRLRKERPEEFENPVAPSVSPTGWVPVRLIVSAATVEVYVGAVKAPTLDVPKLGTLERGMIGLWVGNGSDGDFANLRVSPLQ